MRKQLLAGVAFSAAALMGTAAFAADPIFEPAPVAPPAPMAPAPIFFDWSGPYIGAHVGYGWGKHRAPRFGRTGVRSGEWGAHWDGDDFGTLTDDLDTFTLGNPPFPWPAWDREWENVGLDLDDLPPSAEVIAFQDVFYREDIERLRGVFAGVQAGYNFMATPNLLLGIEADFSWSNVKGSGWAREMWDREYRVVADGGTVAGQFVAFEEFDIHSTLRKRIDWFGTVRARLGLPFDNVLPYVTGGLAWGRVKTDMTLRVRGEGELFMADGDWEPTGATLGFWGPETLFTGAASDRKTRVGWALGGGVEVALDQNWSIKGEYLYIDLGRKTHNFHFVDHEGDSHTFSHKQRVNLHTVKLGINYRFFTGPVAAAPAAPAPVKW